MSNAQETTSKTCDPFEPFRALRDAYLDAMARAMVDTVKTEAYAQATGTMLEDYLAAVAPLREALDKSMLQALQQLELPSRQEVAALAERFTHVEMRLDDMDAKLDEIRKMLHRNGTASEPTEGERIGGSRSTAAKQKSGARATNQPEARRPFVRQAARRQR